MDRQLYNEAVKRTALFFKKAGIIISPSEKEKIEVADFGLNDLYNTGLQILTYVNTERVCAKELVLFPYQTCPEHRHVGSGKQQGKEETFRCRFGRVYLYVEGEAALNPQMPPEEAAPDTQSPPEGVYTVFNEIILNPGEQYTLYPDTKHWFKAGEDGAVVSEFSTKSTDETDIFTDERIVR